MIYNSLVSTKKKVKSNIIDGIMWELRGDIKTLVSFTIVHQQEMLKILNLRLIPHRTHISEHAVYPKSQIKKNISLMKS